MSKKPEILAFEEHIVSTMGERAREFCDFASSLIREGGNTDLAQRCMAAAAACIEVKARADYEAQQRADMAESLISVMDKTGMGGSIGFDGFAPRDGGDDA